MTHVVCSLINNSASNNMEAVNGAKLDFFFSMKVVVRSGEGVL